MKKMNRRERTLIVALYKFSRKVKRFVNSRAYQNQEGLVGIAMFPILMMLIVCLGIYLALTKPSPFFKAAGNEIIGPLAGI